MNRLKRTRLDELKVRANLLLKDLQSADKDKATGAAKRMLALPFLKYSNETNVLADVSFYRLKHTLHVIAIENGQETWNDLRAQVIYEDCLFHQSSPAVLNVWFNNYAEAKTYHQEHGGYLLPYRAHFAVCPKEYIDTTGLGEMQQEWAAIGYDWHQPKDKAAWQTLFDKAKQRYVNKQPVEYKPIDKSKRPAWLNG